MGHPSIVNGVNFRTEHSFGHNINLFWSKLKSVLTFSSGVNICNFGGMTNLGSPENFDPLSRVKNQCLVPGLPALWPKRV